MSSARRRVGITPFVLDPLGVHADADYSAIASLTELAAMIGADG